MLGNSILKEFNDKMRNLQWKTVWKVLDEYGESHNRIFLVGVTIVKSDGCVFRTYTGAGGSLKDARKCAVLSALGCPSFRYCVMQNIQETTHTVDQPEVKKCLQTEITLRDALSVLRRLTQLLCACGTSVYRMNKDQFPAQRVNTFNTCLVLLVFARKRFIGEGCTWSIAEGTAALSAIKSLRKAVVTVLLSSPANGCHDSEGKGDWRFGEEMSSDVDLVRQLQFPKRTDSPLWRLRIVAALHCESPTLEVSRSSSDEGRLQSAKRFTCTCYVPTLGRRKVFGLSRQMAVNRAAKALLSLVNSGSSHDERYTPVSNPLESGVGERAPEQTPRVKKTKPLDKARSGLLHDRCHPAYSECLHPVHRLDCFRSIKGWLPAVYCLRESASELTRVASRSVPSFVCQIKVGPYAVDGPEARNKKLARRLAAECVLKQLNESSHVLADGAASKPTRKRTCSEPRVPDSKNCLVSAEKSEAGHALAKSKYQNQVISFGGVKEIEIPRPIDDLCRLPFEARGKWKHKHEYRSSSAMTLRRSKAMYTVGSLEAP